MAITDRFGRAIGKLFRNLQDYKWYAAEAGKAASSIYVTNAYGRKVEAYLRAHLHIPKKDSQGRIISEDHIGNAYRCDDGHEYLTTGDGSYRYDPQTDSWVHA